MNPSSLPPDGITCPNCGAAQSASVAFCANCGAPLQAATAGRASQTAKTLVSLALGFGAFIFGGLGGCLALIGVMGGNFSTDWPFFACGVAAVGLAVGCIWGILRVQKRK